MNTNDTIRGTAWGERLAAQWKDGEHREVLADLRTMTLEPTPGEAYGLRNLLTFFDAIDAGHRADVLAMLEKQDRRNAAK